MYISKLYEKLVIPNEKRLFIVSDLHGDFDLYEKGCKELGIKDNDVVISLGDRIDRKHKNFACVAEFYKKENRYSILGNHDQMLCEAFLNNNRSMYQCFYQNGGDTTMEECGLEGCKVLAEMSKDCPIVMDVEYQGLRLGLIHAEIPISHNLNQVIEANKISMSLLDDLVWGRNVIDQINKGVEVKSVSDVDYMIHGHTPVHKPFVHGNRVYTDTGAFFTGRLTFAYFEGKELKFYTTRDFDEV